MHFSTVLLVQGLVASSAASASLRGGQQPRELRTRIIGGDEAEAGQYPYAVSLQDVRGHFCGGSMIAPDIVLTAAHCKRYEIGYKAIIGRTDLSATGGDEVTVAEEIDHPNFDWGTTDFDYMLLKLNRTTTAVVGLVTLSPGIVPTGTAVSVMGWGVHNVSDRSYSEDLMETEVFVVSNQECEQSNGTVGGTEVNGTIVGGYDETYSRQISAQMMCAADDGEDSCTGDSGGPLVLRENSGDVQVGIVSWGVECAHKAFPGVYARISSQFEWIRGHVCAESSDPPAYFECDRS